MENDNGNADDGGTLPFFLLLLLVLLLQSRCRTEEDDDDDIPMAGLLDMTAVALRRLLVAYLF